MIASLRRRLSLGVALALAFLLPGLARSDANLTHELAQDRSKRVREISYDLELELAAGATSYRGRVVARFELTSRWRDLHLDFQGARITRVLLAGEALEGWRHEEQKLWLPKASLKRGTNVLEVEYENEHDRDGAGFHRVVDPADGREYVYTDFEPYDASRLFPCFDQPDLKATYGLVVRAPRDWVVVSSGRTLSTRDEGSRRVHAFERLPPFSTYVFALCAGPFAVWTDPEARIPARVLCTQSMAGHMDPGEIFEVTRKGFKFFQDYFGIPYPFHKYDQVFLPQFNAGAMENVACVTFNDRHIFRHEASERERMGRANTILHEMAHMWFGDLVTMRWWNDLWLNESFATYMAHLALVEATRFQDAWEQFAAGSKGWAYWQDQLPTTHAVETPVPDTQTTFTNFDGITYAKGASVLKQLAFAVGEDAFRRGVSDYLKRFKWRNATREDFIRSIATASGIDLERWTRLWLQTAGVNTITPRLVRRDGKVREFWLDQGKGNGDAVLRPHKLKVALYRRGRAGALERYAEETVSLDAARTRVKALEGLPVPDFVDANHGDFAYAKVFLDEGSLAFAMESLEDLPTAFLRGQVWRVLWFMTRDAVVAPTLWLDMVLGKAGQEGDDKLLANVLWNLDDALVKYLTPRRTERYASRIHEVAWTRVREVAPGSDLQKVWFETLVGTARNHEHLDRLEDLLVGSVVVPGLEVDQEKRWDIVTRLCAFGHSRAAAWLEKEEARDDTERGRLASFAAWVARPDRAVKEEAWRRFLEDREAPLAHLRAGMGSFFQAHQAELVAPFAARYFELLPAIERDREVSFVRAFAGSLYPDELVSDATLAAGEKLLADNPRLPYYVVRTLVERDDELRRALKVRDQLKN